MTREKFIEILEDKGYLYEIEGDKLIVSCNTKGRHVYLTKIKSLPSNVVFDATCGKVELDSLIKIPNGVEFHNRGGCDLFKVKEISQGIVFNNSDYVSMGSLKNLPENTDVIFKNGGSIEFGSLDTLPSNIEFNNWERINLGAVTSIPSDVKFNNRGEVSMDKLRRGGVGIKGVNRNLFRLMVKKGMFV